MNDRLELVRRHVRAGVGFLLAVSIALVGVVLGIPATPADASEPATLVEVSLTDVSPDLPSRLDTITLTGRVTNVTDQPLTRLQVLFWRSQQPITDNQGLTEALSSDADQPLGRRLFREPGSYQNLYTPQSPTLAPGASATFSVKADAKALELPPTDGVYLMGVHVLQDGVRIAVGRSRVLVPVLSRKPSASTKVATLVTLTTRPSLLGPGLLADDHLAAEIAPTGRLQQLLEAAQRKNASYAIDPALVSELKTMRDGYLVRDSDGTTRPGPGQADAASWLSSLSQLRENHDGYRLLFAAPDVAALARSRNAAALEAAEAAGSREALTADLPLLVLPVDGQADRATLAAALALQPRAVLLSEAATGEPGPVLDGDGGTPVLSYVNGELGGGPGPDPQDDAVHTRQRALATSWVNFADPEGRRAQVRLVQTPQDVISTSGAYTPWTSSVPLDEVLRRTPSRWNGTLTYAKSLSRAELDKNQLAQSQRLAGAAQTWADLLIDGRQARSESDALIARSVSGSWRGQQQTSAAYLQLQQSSLDARLDQVQISAVPRANTIAQEGISFPITVRNNLPPQAEGGDADPYAVHVELRFDSANAARLKVETVNADAVSPDKAYTANAKVTAKANGTVPVTAQLYTRHGYKIGRAAAIEVNVTQNGTTGWAITLVAGAVLIGSTTWRIRQVGRDRNKSVLASGTTEPALKSVSAYQLGTRDDDASVGS